MAEQLFLEARTLMADKRYELACEKFRASYELDQTATGTLLNLALCHEALGKTATAWAEFRQVAAQSIGRREDRVTLAREHEQKLAPTLSRLTIIVPPATRAPQLRIVLDGREPVVEAAWGIEFPVDPGEHVVVASAPGKKDDTQRFVVGDAADRKIVTVAPLSDVPPEPASEPRPVAAPPPPPAPADGNTRRVTGFVLGGAGIASLGVGLVFGLIASNRNSDAKELCPDDRCPDERTRVRASADLSHATDAANVANVTVGIGALLAAAGTVLVLTAPPSRPHKASAIRFVGAGLVPGGGGVVLRGSY